MQALLDADFEAEQPVHIRQSENSQTQAKNEDDDDDSYVICDVDEAELLDSFQGLYSRDFDDLSSPDTSSADENVSDANNENDFFDNFEEAEVASPTVILSREDPDNLWRPDFIKFYDDNDQGITSIHTIF